MGTTTRNATAAVRRQRRLAVVALAAVCLLTSPASAATATARPAGGHRHDLGHARADVVTALAAQCTNRSRLRHWSTARLVTQVLVAPVQMSSLPTVAPLVRRGIGGLLLFGAVAPNDLEQQLASLQSQSLGGLDPVVMSDEEGGAVQRLKSLVGPVPSARHMGRTMTPQQVRRVGLRVGRRMKAAGVGMDLAPVLDLDDRPGPSATNPDGTRSFGMDPARVSAVGVAFARGLASAGVVASVKHFPGLGYATGNTDVAPASTLPWRVLRRNGLRPFRTAVRDGVPSVMISNASVPGLTARPATLSPSVIDDVLRGDLHFRGAVVTDSLSAGAITADYQVPRATVMSLNAGSDLILFGTGDTTGTRLAVRIIQRVTQAVARSTLSRQRLVGAASHVLGLKRVNLCTA